MKIVKIDWIDSQTVEAGLMTIEEIKTLKPLPCTTVGFLLSENKECVIVCDECWIDKECANYIHLIPKPIIKKITILETIK